jgi:hypothetical protein
MLAIHIACCEFRKEWRKFAEKIIGGAQLLKG